MGPALSGAAMLLVAWNLANPYLFAVAAFAAAAVVPKLASLVGSEWVPLALAVSALGLAFLGERGGRARLLGASGVAHAVLAFGWGLALGVPWFGVIILLAAAAVGVASRVLPWVRPLAVLLAGFALLPRVGPLDAWPWMTPTLSLCLFVPWSLGASVIAARQGRNASTVPSTVLAGLLSMVFPVLAAMSRDGSWSGGDVVLVALSALFTARSLHPSFSIAMASLWPLLYVVASFRAPVALGLAVLLSALGLLESHRAAFRYLAGGRRFALMASLCAMPFLVLACVACHGAVVPFVLAGTALLPLVWTRANREPLFAALAPVFVLLFALVSRELLAWAAALPVVALGVVRATEHLPGARWLLLGSGEEARVRRLSLGMQVALTAVSVAVLFAWGEPPVVFTTLVASLVLLPGPRPSVRVGLGVGLLLGCVPLHPVGIVLLLALGLLTHHAPVKLGAFLRAPRTRCCGPCRWWGRSCSRWGRCCSARPRRGPFSCWRASWAWGPSCCHGEGCSPCPCSRSRAPRWAGRPSTPWRAGIPGRSWPSPGWRWARRSCRPCASWEACSAPWSAWPRACPRDWAPPGASPCGPRVPSP
ncbi:hypothetical protein ACN28S_49305 [Cystobacter fuscus]